MPEGAPHRCGPIGPLAALTVAVAVGCAAAAAADAPLPDCTFESCPQCLPDAEQTRRPIAIPGLGGEAPVQAPFRIGRCKAWWDSQSLTGQIVGIVASELLGVEVEYISCADESSCGLAMNGCAGWQDYECDQIEDLAGAVAAFKAGRKRFPDLAADVWYSGESYIEIHQVGFFKTYGMDFDRQMMAPLGTSGYSSQDGLYIYRDIVDSAWSKHGLNLDSWKAFQLPAALELLTPPQRMLDDGLLGLGGCASEEGYIAAAMEVYRQHGWTCEQSFWLNRACAALGENWTQHCVPIIGDDWGYDKPFVYAGLANSSVPIAKIMVGYDPWWELVYYRTYEALFTWWWPDASVAVHRPFRVFLAGADPLPDPVLKAVNEAAVFADAPLKQVISNAFFSASTMSTLMSAVSQAVEQGYGPDEADENVSHRFYQKIACDYVRANEAEVRQWLPSARSCLHGQRFSEAEQACEDCPIGTHGKISVGRVLTCEACSPGTFADLPGLTQCSPCRPGTFQNGTGSPECMLCPLGQMQADAGKSECSDCAAGSVSAARGAAACLRCMPGTAAAAGGAQCQLCDVGFFAEQAGSAQCRACSAGLLTLSRGAVGLDDCVCPAGSFWPVGGDPGDAGLRCSVCPSYMSCDDGASMAAFLAGRTEHMRLLPGFMAKPSEPSKVFACLSEAACPGGPPGCGPRHDAQSVACGSCEVGAYMQGALCLPCGGSQWHLLLIYIALGIIGVLILSLAVNRDIYTQSHSKMTVMVLMALMLSTFQTLGIFRVFQMQWFSPMAEILEWLSFVSMDLNIVRLGCTFQLGAATAFVCRQFLPLFTIPVICCALGVKKMRTPAIEFSTELINAVGTLLSIFFVSIMVSCSLPFICFPHPDGNGHSVISSPSILCFDDVQHSIMVVGGLLSCIALPMPFMTVASLATWRYRHYSTTMSEVGMLRLRQCRFLFFRFRPECYYWGVALLTRSFFIAVIPVVLTNGALQLFAIAAVVTSFALAQQQLRPWKAHSANFADGFLNMVVLGLLFLGAMAADFADDVATVRILALTIMGLALASWLIHIMSGLVRILRKRPVFHFFICHHKNDAQAQARLLKLQLTVQVGKSVFIDSDDLETLDTLFDIVRSQIHTVLAYLTRDTLTRPWCAGELTVATRVKRPIIRVQCGSFLPPTNWDIRNLEDYIDFSGCRLQKYGIETEDIAAAYLSLLASTPLVVMSDMLHGSVRFEAMVHDVCAAAGLLKTKSLQAGASLEAQKAGSFQASASAKDGEQVPTVSKTKTSAGPKRDMLVISCLPFSDEACAAASVLFIKVRQEMMHVSKHGALVLETDMQEYDETMLRAVWAARAVVVLLSPGSLMNFCQLQVIHTIMQRDAVAQPIAVTLPNFEFPDDAYYSQPTGLRAVGLSDLDSIVPLIKDFFKIIAVAFHTGASDKVLETQAEAIMRRVPRKRKQDARPSRFMAAEDTSCLEEPQGEDEGHGEETAETVDSRRLMGLSLSSKLEFVEHYALESDRSVTAPAPDQDNESGDDVYDV